MTMNYEHETLTQFPGAQTPCLLRRLPQDQVAFRRWQRKGKLPDLVVHPDAENKLFAGLPRADPLVVGCEKNPAVDFGIARSQRHPGGIEALGTQKLDELGRYLLILAQESRFFLGDFGIPLDLTLGFEDLRIDVVLQFIGEFRGILVAFQNVVMTDEVDPQIRRKLKLVPASVSHAHVQAEELIEALAALCQFLRIHQERDREVRPGHRPEIPSVIAAFECTTGRTSSPAHGGQLLFFLRVARRRRQNRANRQRKCCPEEAGSRHESRVYRFCPGNVTGR